MRHGSQLDPPNRFDKFHRELDFEHVEWDEEYLRDVGNRRIRFIADTSRTIVSENQSPDIPFRYSVNPYRGCIHGCSYCYARPGHEFLGYNAGLDFETRIFVKEDAPELLRTFLSRESWRPEPIMFSGVTDCYQPAERQFRLTRGCLEVAADCAQPIDIITKNALVLRDLDLLAPMAHQNTARVVVSIPTLDPELAREMEPRTSIPAARLRAIETLAEANIPVAVMVAPIIPGLTDSEIPAILTAAAEAGAQSARYVLLRLPQTVEPVFIEWLHRTQESRAEKVLARIRDTRGGEMNESTWGTRMRGTGERADQIAQVFDVFSRQTGLNQTLPSLNCDEFRRPQRVPGQKTLF